jgi:hypothetical protein
MSACKMQSVSIQFLRQHLVKESTYRKKSFLISNTGWQKLAPSIILRDLFLPGRFHYNHIMPEKEREIEWRAEKHKTIYKPTFEQG